MRFASLTGAFILLLLVLTPLKHAARYLAGQGVAGGFLPSLAYLLILASFWVVLTGIFWAVRRWLVFADAWASSGLAGLDRGVHGQWALGWWLFLSALLVAGAVVAGPEQRAAAVAEAIAASASVLVAFLGPPPETNPVDEYDPLPLPAPSPEPLPPVPSPVPGPPAPGEVIPLTMWWYFRREAGDLRVPPVRCEVRVNASKARYEQLRTEDHRVARVQDYARFVRDGLTPEVAETTRQMRQISETERLTTVAEINNVLAFAQRFEYAFDIEDKGVSEYPKFPLETMVEDRGDCEDHAILAAACLVRLGYEVRLVSLEYDAGPGHMALAVAGAEELPDAFSLRDPATGRRFYYCEVTADASSRDPNTVAFRMGEVPAKDKQARMELIPVA